MGQTRSVDKRGNSRDRHARKLFLLNKFGDGEKAPCWECGTMVDYDSIVADRIIPGEQGGTYRRNNIRVHCVKCSGQQGQRRTVEICNERRRHAAGTATGTDADTADAAHASRTGEAGRRNHRRTTQRRDSR